MRVKYWLSQYCFFVIILTVCNLSWGQSGEKGDRRVQFEMGASGGYLLMRQTYGDGGEIEKKHLYGGAIGGGEFGIKWPVADRLQLGLRLSGQGGNLSHPCESTSCGYNVEDHQTDCTCQYSTYPSGLTSISFVLDVIFRDWMWLDINAGLFVPIDSQREPLPGLLGGIGLGFSILNARKVSPYLRLGCAIAWQDHVGVVPQAALGIRF
jgi:hypothetical protein